MYQYRAYGLSFLSVFELKGFLPCNRNMPADVDIVHDAVALPADKNAAHNFTHKVSDTEFLMNVPGVVRISVSNGNRMVVDFSENAETGAYTNYITGSGMAALLQQNDFLTLHASCIKSDKGGVIFLGKSGTGKSTTCSAMMKRGYALVADDITAIRRSSNGSAEILPAPPVTRLWNDTAAVLKRNTQEGWKVLAEQEKFNLPVNDHHVEPVRPHKIFILSSDITPVLDVQPISKSESLHILRRFTYRKNYLALMGRHAFHFNAITQLNDEVEIVRLNRGSGKLDPAKLADVIEKEIG